MEKEQVDKIVNEIVSNEKLRAIMKKLNQTKSMNQRQPLIRELLSELFSKLPNPIKFVEYLKQGNICIDAFIQHEKIKEVLVFIGSQYNYLRAVEMHKTKQPIPDFCEFLDALFSLPSFLEMFRVLRPDLYAVLTDIELNEQYCLLIKFEKARREMLEKLKELPYKTYTVKAK